METDQHSPHFWTAVRDFRRARQQAILENIVAHLTGKSADLLSYEDVYELVKEEKPVERGLQEIPLAAIVGSVGRYTDFSRSFLPRRKSDQQHWAEVKAFVDSAGEIPPITVYKLDQVYFVLDGNHRVSIARQSGLTHIKAYVTEIRTPVPLSPDLQPDEIIIATQYADFLEETNLATFRPGADLRVTAPGQYRILKEQIEVHRHWLSQKEDQPISYQEAVTHWYDDLYLPTVQIIRQRGILRDFPERTETDLYVWLSKHQVEMKQALGWDVAPEAVARDLVTRFSARPKRVIARLKEKVLDALTPDPMEAGPPPGQWREEHLAIHPNERLFAETLCLVPVKNEEADWRAFGQALVVARREEGRLHGLHVGSLARPENQRQAEFIRREFRERCDLAGIRGELSFEQGNVTRQICDRGRWVDLIIVSLRHPPDPQPAARLRSGFRTLIRRCSRPVLAVTGAWSHLNRPLLAYDGSPKANEALFVAAYLAGRWQLPLTVVTVIDAGQATPDTLAQAQAYLEKQGVQATLVPERGPVAQAIIKTAEARQTDLIIMGGYGFSPVLEVMFGSELDQVLQAQRWPVLICR